MKDALGDTAAEAFRENGGFGCLLNEIQKTGWLMMKIVSGVVLVMLGDMSDPYSILTMVLYLVGLWAIFCKSGIEGWWALIPCARQYKLGLCAGREPEGRVLAVVDFLMIVTGLCSMYLQLSSISQGFLALAQLIIMLINVVYMIRVYNGLTEVYGRRKGWVLLWVLIDCVPALLWGFRKDYQPVWKVEDIKSEAANFFSGKKVDVLDKGLTVNLEERTVWEFFRKKYLLRDIHMYIQPGHMVLLLGGSGAGKTTCLNAINGYEKAKAEVVLDGTNMYKHYKEMQYNIGFVPQMDLMRGSDSVFRTLMDAASLRLPKDFSSAERKARVEDVMKIFGLTPVENNMVEKLSGGQRKRLSIAMEFISNPSLFILDEPDSGLDGVMARELFEQLRLIADQGKIIIVITHTPDRVIDLFDDVIVLAKDAKRTGRLAYFGPIDEARAFFGKESMEEIVKSVNRQEEGGEGRADEFILKYAEVQHG